MGTKKILLEKQINDQRNSKDYWLLFNYPKWSNIFCFGYRYINTKTEEKKNLSKEIITSIITVKESWMKEIEILQAQLSI